MTTTVTPLFTKYAKLTLALTSGPNSGTSHDFECSATSVGLVSTGGEVVSLNTLCPDGSFSETNARAWQLSVTAAQDVESADSLMLFLIDNAGEKATATFYPKTDSAKNPVGRGWEGTVTVALPDNIGGGTIGTYATFTAVLPFEGKPQGIDPAGNPAPPLPAAPAFTSIAPATGVAAGGLVTTITGTNLTGATGVTFGGVAGTAFSVTNATTVKATTPAHAAGVVDVVLQHPTANATKTGGFTYT